MRILWIFIFSLLFLQATAQERGIFGVGISGGAMNYLGDLDDDLSIIFTRTGYGFHLNFLPLTKFNVALTYLHGEIMCDDAKDDISDNRYRNLKFYSNIDEISFQMIYRFQSKKNTFTLREPAIPYFFAGVAVFHFNPKTKLNGVEYELQPIGTEGQQLSHGNYPAPYKLWQISIPFGAGIKYKLSRQTDLGFEIGLRKTFTDYLDDVSGFYPDKEQLLQEEGEIPVFLSDRSNDPKRPNGRNSLSARGNPDRKDWYIYTNVNFTYYFTTKLIKAKQRFSQIF